jgi:hypothetical protein
MKEVMIMIPCIQKKIKIKTILLVMVNIYQIAIGKLID